MNEQQNQQSVFLPKHLNASTLGLIIALCLSPFSAALAADGIEVSGKQQFLDYCAVCHGESAKGDGPFANVLNKPPTDLTMLAKNNDGRFPFLDVYEAIDGRELPGAHGARDMPVWGGTWKQGNTLGSETALRGRILEMIIYLNSIQQ